MNARRAPQGGPDGARPDRDREFLVTEEIRDTFLRIGLDIDDPDAADEFRLAIKWATDEQERQQRWRDRRRHLYLAAITSVIGGITTAAVTWITSHMPGGGHG